MVQKEKCKMSTRGGYGFVLNGQEKIIYVGNGAEFGCLGDTVLNWLRMITAEPVNNLSIILERIAHLTVVENDEMCSVDGLQHYDWGSVMRQISYNPGSILDVGYYVDASWLIDDVDCEYLYMIDFDKGVFEIYYDTYMARTLPASGRFNSKSETTAMTREAAAYINMIASFSFDTLPKSIAYFEQDIFEPEFWE